MGNKNRYLLAGLAAGAIAYLRKPENREKAMQAFNDTKTKVNDMMNQKKEEFAEKKEEFEQKKEEVVNNKDDVEDTSKAYEAIPDADSESSYYLRDRRMVNEGAMTTVQYYNEGKQEQKDLKNDVEHSTEDNKNKMTLDADTPSPKVASPDVHYRPNGVNNNEEGTDSEHLRDRDMLSEGAGTTVQYYNEQQQKNSDDLKNK